MASKAGLLKQRDPVGQIGPDLAADGDVIRVIKTTLREGPIDNLGQNSGGIELIRKLILKPKG